MKNRLVTLLFTCIMLSACTSVPDVRVLDESGAPIQGATVRVDDFTTRIDPAFEAKTDLEGIAELSNFTNLSGAWMIEVSKVGYTPRTIHDQEHSGSDPIPITLERIAQNKTGYTTRD